MKPILEVKELNKFYFIDENESQHILRNINLSIRQGEFVAVMGASGSGKSTLLYNISGIDRPTSGMVNLMGRSLQDLSEDELAKLRLISIGYIFQQSNLLRNLNLFDNIVLPAYRAGKENRCTINKRADNLMKHLGITELAKKDITQASGGQLQRIAICRALINNPSFIFGDEPTGALNSSTTSEVMNILEDINAKGTTILIVTHDVKVAARADRVLYMMDGSIVGQTKLNETIPSKRDIHQRETYLSDWLKARGF